jgi:hypothetical protein
MSSGEDVLPASKFGATLKQIKKLQGPLGKKPSRMRFSGEIVKGIKPHEWFARSPLLPEAA